MAAVKATEKPADESGFITRLRDEIAHLYNRHHELKQEIEGVAAEILLKQQLLHRSREETLVDGIRRFFRLRDNEAATAKEIERWLVIQGWRTRAEKFYQSVYATLRGMADVTPIAKPGETIRFLPKVAQVPPGWIRMHVAPRTTSAARKGKQAQKGNGKGRW